MRARRKAASAIARGDFRKGARTRLTIISRLPLCQRYDGLTQSLKFENGDSTPPTVTVHL